MLSPSRCVASLGLPLLISWYGVRRRSLSLSGGLAAVAVGAVLTAASGCYCLSLLAFFLTSSKLTKWKAAEKKRIEHDHREGGQRNWVQVLSNGGVASMAALLSIAGGGFGERPFSMSSLPVVACVSSLACCCGDTWASEVGSVVGGTPYLITTWRRAPKGTNGGVTFVGVVCSFAGGLAVGVAYFMGLFLFVGFVSVSDAAAQGGMVVLLGGVAGLYGSLVDSLLGATVQYSGFSKEQHKVVHRPGEGVAHISGWNILDNHAVNFASSAVTALTFALVIFVYM